MANTPELKENYIEKLLNGQRNEKLKQNPEKNIENEVSKIKKEISQNIQEAENKTNEQLSLASEEFDKLKKEFKENTQQADELNKKQKQDYRENKQVIQNKKKAEREDKNIENLGKQLEILKLQDKGLEVLTEIATKSNRENLSRLSEAVKRDLQPSQDDDKKTKKAKEARIKIFEKAEQDLQKTLEKYTQNFFENLKFLPGKKAEKKEDEIKKRTDENKQLKGENYHMEQQNKSKKAKTRGEVLAFKNKKTELENNAEEIKQKYQDNILKIKQGLEQKTETIYNNYNLQMNKVKYAEKLKKQNEQHTQNSNPKLKSSNIETLKDRKSQLKKEKESLKR